MPSLIKSLFVAYIFTSAGLLLLVQPMLAKALLPYVGGAPAAWITSMLFFQLVLLGGYGYAVFSSRLLTITKQRWLHLGLLIAAIFFCLPLSLQPAAIESTQYPEWWVLGSLALTVGLPYFFLSANSSLMQHWFRLTFKTSPYFLFAASNFGSLIGLFSFSLVLEWLLDTDSQYQVWSIGFYLLGAMLLAICFLKPSDSNYEHIRLEQFGIKRIALLVALGFAPSSLMLGSTLYITTDIASFPLLWTLPLALYLISFIIVFSSHGERWTSRCQQLHPLAAVAGIMAMMITGLTWLMFLHLLFFFVIAVSCHGRAASLKPHDANPAWFYFWLSLGGVLGGAFNSMAPYLFSDVIEYPLVLLLSVFLLPRLTKASPSTPPLSNRKSLIAGLLLVSVMGGVWLIPEQNANDFGGSQLLHKERNFFGVSKILRDDRLTFYQHGTTNHGYQPVAEQDKLRITSYYHIIQRMLGSFAPSFFERPFAVVGLGAGTMACYAKAGQRIDFFEIDPVVIDIASNPDFFTYLRDCPAQKRIINGDGRLKLAEEPDATYQLMIMDAFTSDAVPFHLLTKEAIAMYQQKIIPSTGILMFHISNRHIDYRPILAGIAKANNMESFALFDLDDPKEPYDQTSIWMVMLPPESPWRNQVLSVGFKPYNSTDQAPLWTDNYSNIIPVIKW